MGIGVYLGKGAGLSLWHACQNNSPPSPLPPPSLNMLNSEEKFKLLYPKKLGKESRYLLYVNNNGNSCFSAVPFRKKSHLGLLCSQDCSNRAIYFFSTGTEEEWISLLTGTVIFLRKNSIAFPMYVAMVFPRFLA